MKSIKEILESDLLERFVLGDVTDSEIFEVEKLRASHIEVRQALDALEQTTERLARDQAIAPRASLKEVILSKIKASSPGQVTTGTNAFYRDWWKYAASFLLGSIALWVVSNNAVQTVQKELVEARVQYQELEQSCDLLQNQYALINDSNSQPVLLTSTNRSSDKVLVYWNEQRADALLRIIDLPEIQEDQTYQVWADVNGEMLDLGIIDHNIARDDFVSIGYIPDATSLNITIEPEGGSKHPTISTLTVSQAI